MSDPAALTAIKPADLPAPPNAAIRIVHACTNSEVTNKELAEIINRDPVMAVELLRIANSAYFGLQKEVRTIPHAITVLGHHALRNLVLCTAMRDAVRPEMLPGLDVQQFWDNALRRAVCASCLSEIAGLDVDQCFTIGLLQDFGLLVMFYIKPERISHWIELQLLSPPERRTREQQIFSITHDQVGNLLADSWGLPEDLSLVVGQHHSEPPSGASTMQVKLCRLALCADWMAAVFSAEDKKTVIEDCKALLWECFEVDTDSSTAFLQSSTAGVEQAAAALGFKVATPLRFEDVLRQANLRLVEENTSYQELTWKLEQALEERNRYANELNKELELAREVQRSLLPNESEEITGIVGVNISAKAVSGDFYDYFSLRDGRVYFCLADVAGKGMNAALLMAKTGSLFRCLGKALHNPEKLLAMLNREIAETSVRGMFVTMVAGVYDPATDRVRLVNAGHLPVMHVSRAGAVQQYRAQSPPLGILPDSGFPSVEFTLNNGSLYLFTDGLIESRATSGEQLGTAGLLSLIEQHTQLPAKQRIEGILTAVASSDRIVNDDLTLLLVES